MSANIWTVGLFVVVAVIVGQTIAAGIYDLDMSKCGIDHAKFMNVASKGVGCEDLMPKDERQLDQETMNQMLGAIQHKMTCFGLSSGYLDPQTNSLDVDKFEEAVTNVATNEMKGKAIVDAFADCNTEGAKTLGSDQLQGVMMCFFGKFFTGLCELGM